MVKGDMVEVLHPIDVKCMVETMQETSSINELASCIERIYESASGAGMTVERYIRDAMEYCDQILCIPEEVDDDKEFK